MRARVVLQALFVLVCLTSSVAGAQDDPTLALYLHFDDLQRTGHKLTTTDASRYADVFEFSPLGIFSLVGHGRGRALRAASPAHTTGSSRHVWTDERIPDSAMSVLMWSRLEGRLSDVSFMVSNSEGSVAVRASSGTGPGEGGSLIYGWSMLRAFKIKEPFPPTDAWVHYAATFDETTGLAKVYVDGELVAETASDAPIPQDWGGNAPPDPPLFTFGPPLADGPILMPRGHGGSVLQFALPGALGDAIVVDDLSVWTRALSPSEIRHIMTDGPLVTDVSRQGKLATSWGLLKRQ